MTSHLHWSLVWFVSTMVKLTMVKRRRRIHDLLSLYAPRQTTNHLPPCDSHTAGTDSGSDTESDSSALSLSSKDEIPVATTKKKSSKSKAKSPKKQTTSSRTKIRISAAVRSQGKELLSKAIVPRSQYQPSSDEENQAPSAKKRPGQESQESQEKQDDTRTYLHFCWASCQKQWDNQPNQWTCGQNQRTSGQNHWAIGQKQWANCKTYDPFPRFFLQTSCKTY